MPLAVISRVSFEFWGDFWRKNRKKGKPEKSGQNGILRRSVGCLAVARSRG